MDRKDTGQRGLFRIIPWWWALIGVIAVLAFSAVTTLVLLAIARRDASLRIEAIKVGLSVGAGTGGAAALLLAFRRQWLGEHVARETSYDATERRVTELYAKAVEQLGHDKAPVRLGGLYSLERLAQDHREHRQTVVDVICAYLRMPFEPPPGPRSQAPDGADQPDTATPSSALPDDGADSDSRQELQVRLAAQRLLTRHLAIPDDNGDAGGRGPDAPAQTHWQDMRIDLNGAVLVDLDFTRCRLHQADFSKTQFSGTAGFEDTHFTGDARFSSAHFSGPAEFSSAHFSGPAGFSYAQFDARAGFDRAHFSGRAGFSNAQFGEDAWFSDARFSEDARFSAGRFSGDAWFADGRFSGDARFGRAQFSGNAMFNNAQFGDDARFEHARFSGRAEFHLAQFGGSARFEDTHFSADARFSSAQFGGHAGFSRAQFSGHAGFRDARFSAEAWFYGARVSLPDNSTTWPPGWQVEPSSSDPSEGLLVEVTTPDIGAGPGAG